MSLSLQQIVPWGRTQAEYVRMFQLSQQDLTGPLLDCGGGPASFAAGMAELGKQVVSVDPIYAFGGEEIRQRFEAVAAPLIAQVKATPGNWCWKYHANADALLAARRSALEAFLADYSAGRTVGRYVAASLPELPFSDQSFGLALCSHLLFLYSELLSETFHRAAIRELCRVAREVRLFPILTLAGTPSPHLDAVCATAVALGWRSELLTVNYELQRGGNQMLRIWRPAS